MKFNLCVLNVIFLSSFALLSCRKNDSPFRAKCKSEMYQISSRVFSLWRDNVSLENDDELTLEIIKSYRNNGGIFDQASGRVRGKSILDPAGRPYRIHLKGGLLTIWSVGLNGIDENGKSDDVTLTTRVRD